MKLNNDSSFFDPSLMPQNAKKKGYSYINDIWYDFLNPTTTMLDILEFSKKFHCKIGMPENITSDLNFGFYIPIHQAYDNNYNAK